jgi:hypothetical protein
MQRILEVIYDGKASSFTVAKISRSKLYGSKHRIAVDAQGQECSRAALTRDGRFILANGCTAALYLDEAGDVVERSRLQAIDADGEITMPGESTPDAALEVGQVLSAAEVLDCSITHAYALEPVFISAELEASLSRGEIYRLPECNGRQAFLLGNDAGYFLLFGERTGFEFIGLAEADLSPPDLDGEYMDEDLDFAMF